MHDVHVTDLQSASLADVVQMLNLSESRLESIGLVVAGIAHDINNLLTVIGGFGNLLRGHIHCDKLVAVSVNGLSEATSQMTSLMRMLSSLASRRSMTAEPINVNGVLAGMQRTVAHLLGDRIRLEVRGNAYPPEVSAIRGQLERVLLNLVLNARDAMGRQGTLLIESRTVRISAQEAGQKNIAAGDYISLTVADTGCGMSPSVMAQIFEPHYSSKGTEGAGHGLATVKRLVHECGGSIFVESTPGRGSTFEVLLPLCPSAENQAAALDIAAM